MSDWSHVITGQILWASVHLPYTVHPTAPLFCLRCCISSSKNTVCPFSLLMWEWAAQSSSSNSVHSLCEEGLDLYFKGDCGFSITSSFCLHEFQFVLVKHEHIRYIILVPLTLTKMLDSELELDSATCPYFVWISFLFWLSLLEVHSFQQNLKMSSAPQKESDSKELIVSIHPSFSLSSSQAPKW